MQGYVFLSTVGRGITGVACRDSSVRLTRAQTNRRLRRRCTGFRGIRLRCHVNRHSHPEMTALPCQAWEINMSRCHLQCGPFSTAPSNANLGCCGSFHARAAGAKRCFVAMNILQQLRHPRTTARRIATSEILVPGASVATLTWLYRRCPPEEIITRAPEQSADSTTMRSSRRLGLHVKNRAASATRNETMFSGLG